MNQNWQISRRKMLKGVGVMMGLPLLEAMKPLTLFAGPAVGAAVKKHPVRMAFLYMANGVNPHTWAPKGVGSEFELSEALQPLAPLQKEIVVLQQLWNAGTNTGDGHYVKTAAWLTGTTITKTTGSNLRSGGVSIDQIAAQRLGNLTPLPSLELGIEPVTTGVDTNVGYTRLYGSHISWSTPTTPVAKEINPQLAFDRLFRSTLKDSKGVSPADSSVLDAVLEDAKRLRAHVGGKDREKLDEYFDSVRAVERRIEFDAKRRAEEYDGDSLARKEIDRLGGRIKDYYLDPADLRRRGVDHTEHVRLMLDIMALAFWTDSTRVSTLMFGNAVSGKGFSFLKGVGGGHHQISHHENKAENLEQYKLINIWHVQQYAYLLEKLRSIKEGEGTLLDNSMIVFGAGMHDGNRHDPHNLPIVVGGRGGGTIATGRNLVYEKNTPLCNLWRSMLTGVGSPVDKLADSTGELVGLNDPRFRGTAAA
ncbi:MAG TPA: DUF1552 domain-containing protein [Methylomirabilota bacterium]|nr:DUF1552 domain-containing protein [Methylomirabilota bacterium]